MAVSLEDWLPLDHLAWFVLEAMGQIDLKPLYRVCREDSCEGASIGAGTMSTLFVYAHLQEMWLSQQIEEKCQDEIFFRVITVSPMPDYGTIEQFRKNGRGRIQHLSV